MAKVSSIVTYNKVNANYFAVLKRLISTENKNIHQPECATNFCEANDVKPYDSIPGPKPVPIFGYLWHTLPFVGKYHGILPHEVHIRYQKEYGNIVRIRELKYMKDMVLCFDPKDIETVFRNDGPWPKRDILPSIKYYREVMRPEVFQGYGGVFTSEDETWQEGRSVMNSIMMQPRVVKHYINNFSAVADDFVERIRFLAAQNELREMPNDFDRELMKWALESVGVLSLDTRLGFLDSNTNSDPEKIQYIENIIGFFGLVYKIDVLPSLARYFSTPTWKKYVKVMDDLANFVQKHIDLTIKRIGKEGNLDKKDINDMSVIEKLIIKHDKKYLFATVMDVLVGGVDTTAKTMGHILYLLAINPDKQEILRREVNEILPKDDEVLTIQKLEKMPYLRAAIKESMRMISITLGIARLTTKDMVLSGYHIPKGTYITTEQIPLLTRDEYFPEAHKFKPERWLRINNKKRENNPWVMLPFGFGPRSCVGRRIAQLELEVLLTKIMKHYKIEWHYGKPEYGFNMIFSIKSPLKFRMISKN